MEGVLDLNALDDNFIEGINIEDQDPRFEFETSPNKISLSLIENEVTKNEIPLALEIDFIYSPTSEDDLHLVDIPWIGDKPSQNEKTIDKVEEKGEENKENCEEGSNNGIENQKKFKDHSEEQIQETIPIVIKEIKRPSKKVLALLSSKPTKPSFLPISKRKAVST